MWTKGRGTNSVKPPVRRWIWRSTSRWLAQERGPSMWPIIIVVVARRPSSWAVIITSAHSAVRTLSGHRWARTRSSRISAAVPGRVPRPASRRRVRNSRTLMPSVWAPCQTSSGVKPWTCIWGRRSLIALEHRDVEVAGEVRVDAALQADLGGPELPGLDRAVDHLVDVQDVGVAAQVEALGPAREAAEAAAEVALVGVVDVAVDDVGDRVAAAARAQGVGHLRDRLDLGPAGAEEPLDLGHPRRACPPASARGSPARSGARRPRPSSAPA